MRPARAGKSGAEGAARWGAQRAGRSGVARLGGGRPRTRPDRVLSDKAYTSKGNRGYLRRRGIKACIPSKADQDAHRRAKGSKGGRPSATKPLSPSQRSTSGSTPYETRSKPETPIECRSPQSSARRNLRRDRAGWSPAVRDEIDTFIGAFAATDLPGARGPRPGRGPLRHRPSLAAGPHGESGHAVHWEDGAAGWRPAGHPCRQLGTAGRNPGALTGPAASHGGGQPQWTPSFLTSPYPPLPLTVASTVMHLSRAET